jgi:hypothetical protein
MTLAARQVVVLVASLIDAATTLADYTDKPWPADKANLPAFAVADDDEDDGGSTIHSPSIEIHDLTVRIELRVAAVTGLNAAMAAATAEVLTAVNAPSAVSALAAAGVQVWRWVRTERDRKSTGEADIGVVYIDYLARFAVAANAPETILGATP